MIQGVDLCNPRDLVSYQPVISSRALCNKNQRDSAQKNNKIAVPNERRPLARLFLISLFRARINFKPAQNEPLNENLI